MRSVLIVGAGPAAVGAALALVQSPDLRITVLDIGGRLEDANEDARARLALEEPARWAPADRELISKSPVGSPIKGVPQKRSFGSDFPFRDFGQLSALHARGAVNDAVVSGAYGGFSNVWGAQIMPFTSATFRAWPVSFHEMLPHYAAILREVPHAGEHDDLADLFPLIGRTTPLPELSPRSMSVLSRYERNRARLNRDGVILGRARLAMSAPACNRCGLCLSGCPYGLIYSASHTLDKLRRQHGVTYRRGLLALTVEEHGSAATVVAKELHTGRLQRFTADRVLLACGAIGTSRIVMGSLGLADASVSVAESVQFMLPFLSRSRIPDPQRSAAFTLNQFNMVLKLDADGYDVSQLHFYTYNPTFREALPAVLRTRRMRGVRNRLLERLSVALGYLPSWASPDFSLSVRRSATDQSLPEVTLTAGRSNFARNPMLRDVLRRVSTSAPALDLWPVLPMLRLSSSGKSYHWGSTFPHADPAANRFSSDTLGRVRPWARIHLVDASVFPAIPATTFTLSIMANAHRIADGVQRELD
jgi:choline dehydrogenase-like flavoprotein